MHGVVIHGKRGIRRRLDDPEPKQLTEEEIKEYNKKHEEILELFTEINLRQMNHIHETVPEGEGEQDQNEPEDNCEECLAFGMAIAKA